MNWEWGERLSTGEGEGDSKAEEVADTVEDLYIIHEHLTADIHTYSF